MTSIFYRAQEMALPRPSKNIDLEDQIEELDKVTSARSVIHI